MGRDKRSDGRQVRIGNIENSSGIVIGDKSYVVMNKGQSAEREQVLILVEEFIKSIEFYGGALGGSQGVVRESAVAVRDEVATPAPKWQAVRRLLAAIAASVAGIAALTDAISNIQAIITHLID